METRYHMRKPVAILQDGGVVEALPPPRDDRTESRIPGERAGAGSAPRPRCGRTRTRPAATAAGFPRRAVPGHPVGRVQAKGASRAHRISNFRRCRMFWAPRHSGVQSTTAEHRCCRRNAGPSIRRHFPKHSKRHGVEPVTKPGAHLSVVRDRTSGEPVSQCRSRACAGLGSPLR